MVSYSELRNLDTSMLTSAATASGGLSGDLSSRGGELASAAQIPGGTWHGADASAATGKLSPLPDPLYDASDAFRHGQGVLETLVDSLLSAKERLQDAHGMAAGTGIVIGADGSVTTPVVDSPTQAERNLERARQIREIIDEALEMAEEADSVAVEDIANKRPLQDVLPHPDDMNGFPLLVAGPWVDNNLFPGASHLLPLGYEQLYEHSDLIDVWGDGDFKLDKDGLGAHLTGGMGWKEGVQLGEDGEYGTVTGMVGVEGNADLSVGPSGVNGEVGGFAGGSVNYTTPSIDAGPGDTEATVGVTPRFGVGAEASFNAGYEDGKFNIGGKAGVALGPGISVAPEVSVDVGAVADSVGDAASSVNDVMPWNW